MKAKLLVLGTALLSVLQAFGQGQLLIRNPNAPTRLWSMDGPVAGPGIWGQMLAGPTPESLMPVGAPDEHNVFGLVFGGVVEVATVPCDTFGYAQLVAWDGRLWGTSLELVPPGQRGATDVVSVSMRCFGAPVAAPHFTQPAIVPIPEPFAWALAFLGAVSLLWFRGARRNTDAGSAA
jgi:hypothetical protein